MASRNYLLKINYSHVEVKKAGICTLERDLLLFWDPGHRRVGGFIFFSRFRLYGIDLQIFFNKKFDSPDYMMSSQ